MKDQLEIIVNIAKDFAKVAKEFGSVLDLNANGIKYHIISEQTWGG